MSHTLQTDGRSRQSVSQSGRPQYARCRFVLCRVVLKTLHCHVRVGVMSRRLVSRRVMSFPGRVVVWCYGKLAQPSQSDCLIGAKVVLLLPFGQHRAMVGGVQSYHPFPL
jgi:hypothetical protein